MEIIHTRRSYWEINNFPYDKIIELPENDLKNLIPVLTRQDIIEWLIWNDRNGVYSDEQSIREFGEVLPREEAVAIMLNQIEENRIPATNLKIID